MGRTPLFLPLAAVVSGILLAEYFGGSLIFVLTVILIGVLGALIRPGTPALFVAFCGIGWGVTVINRPVVEVDSGYHSFSGTVGTVNENYGTGSGAIVTIDSIDGNKVAAFKGFVHLIGHDKTLTETTVIRFRSALTPLAAPPDVPDWVDLSRGLKRKGVAGYLLVLPDSIIETGYAGGIMPALRRWNRSLQVRLASANVSPLTYALLSAIMLGKSDFIPQSQRETYSAAGLSHLLALSGTHVAVIVSLVSFALWPLYVARRNKPRWLLTIVALWVYAAMTGMSPSVERAVVMASVYYLGRVLERGVVPMNSLFLAALLILLFEPLMLFTAGFQMSFAAVGGIILFYPLLNRVNRRRHPLLYRLWAYPALSVSAMVLTSFVVAFHFHVFPFWFLLANLFAVPLVPLMITCGVVALIFPSVAFLGQIADLCCSALDFIASAVSKLPGAVETGLYLPVWVTVSAVALLILLACGMHFRRLALTIASLMLFAGVFTAHALSRPVFPESEYFLIEERTHSYLIVRNGRDLLLYAPQRLEAEREESRRRFSIMLSDYMGRRSIDSLKLAEEKECRTLIIESDTICLR